jgi:hypothetical protein
MLRVAFPRLLFEAFSTAAARYKLRALLICLYEKYMGNISTTVLHCVASGYNKCRSLTSCYCQQISALKASKATRRIYAQLNTFARHEHIASDTLFYDKVKNANEPDQ